MTEILINKEIGAYTMDGEAGVTADAIKKALENAKEDDEVRFVIDSPGGDCFEGIAVYNVIRDFARNHKAPVNTYIRGSACSAASWIALAASSVNENNRVIVEDNSVFMVHNCWGLVIGDHREMEKQAELSKRVDDVMRTMLVKKGNKTTNEVKDMMDAETWLFGKEIFENGFADEVISDNKKEKTEEALLVDLAQKRFDDCKKMLSQFALKDSTAFKASLSNSVAYFAKVDEEARLAEQKEVARKAIEERKAKVKKENADRLSFARKIYSDYISKD